MLTFGELHALSVSQTKLVWFHLDTQDREASKAIALSALILARHVAGVVLSLMAFPSC